VRWCWRWRWRRLTARVGVCGWQQTPSSAGRGLLSGMWRQKGAAGKKQRPAVWVTAGVYAQQVKPEKLGLQPRPQVKPAIDRDKNRSSD
jgi:hypothetical protein